MSVKHGKNKYPDLDLDPDAATEDFKAQMFSLTGVEPERQKVGRIQFTAPALVCAGGTRPVTRAVDARRRSW